MKKIFIFSSSLRKGSNSEILALKIKEGAERSGNIVKFLSARDIDVKYCTGCLSCVKTGKCVLQDSMNGLYKEIAESFENGWLDLARLENKYNYPLTVMTEDILNQWEKAGVIVQQSGKIILTKAGQFWFVNLSQLLQEFIKLTMMFNEKDVCMTVTAG